VVLLVRVEPIRKPDWPPSSAKHRTVTYRRLWLRRPQIQLPHRTLFSGQLTAKVSGGICPAQISDGKVYFVKYYAPWCGHCKRLAPTWDELADAVSGTNVVIAKVDCTVAKSVCTGAGVQGYPTLKLVQNGKVKEDYRGAQASPPGPQFAPASLQTLFAPQCNTLSPAGLTLGPSLWSPQVAATSLRSSPSPPSRSKPLFECCRRKPVRSGTGRVSASQDLYRLLLHTLRFHLPCESTRSSLNIIWPCGLFEGKGVSTSRVSPPGPLSIA
jgi:protein disulfide-isomerase-like protein